MRISESLSVVTPSEEEIKRQELITILANMIKNYVSKKDN
jgi:hypothetical protein